MRKLIYSIYNELCELFNELKEVFVFYFITTKQQQKDIENYTIMTTENTVSKGKEGIVYLMNNGDASMIKVYDPVLAETYILHLWREDIINAKMRALLTHNNDVPKELQQNGF